MRTEHGVTNDFLAPGAVRGWQTRALLAAAVGLAIAIIGAVINPAAFFRAWLIGFVLVWNLSMGCLGWLFVYHLTGGKWGTSIRRILEAGANCLPLVALMSVPVLFGMHYIYEWSHADVVAKDAHLTRLGGQWLNPTFFTIRLVVYFAIWYGFTFVLTRISRRQDEANPPDFGVRLRGFSGVGLVVLALLVTLASVDWVMSLDPHWYSTLWGLYFVNAQSLIGLAMAIIIVAALRRRSDLMAHAVTPEELHDLGKLLFAMNMVWGYFGFSQYLIIWSGNLPEEITWVINRTRGGWQFVAISILIGFAATFIVLLSRDLKRKAKTLVAIAAFVLFLRWLDMWWLIQPNFVHEGQQPHLDLSYVWLDLAAPAGLIGLWLAMLFWNLRKRPLLAVHDVHVTELLERHGH